MLTHDQRIIHSSEESNWRTPPDCFGRLDEEFNFGIDLAASDGKLVARYFGPGSHWAEDALAVDWSQWALHGPMFLNPPYSKTMAAAYSTGRIKINGEWVEHEKDEIKARAQRIESWVSKCWEESQKGCTIVAILPFAPQTEWYRAYVMGHEIRGQRANGTLVVNDQNWSGHAAMEERRIPHRISFLRPDGSPASNAGVNSVVIVWKPNPGYVGPWQPAVRYWSYR